MAVARVKPQGRLIWECELGEDLTAGDPVVVYDDAGAKIKKCMSTVGGACEFARGYYSQLAKIGTNKYVIVYRDIANNSHGYVCAFSFDADGFITQGTPYRFYNVSVSYIDICSIGTDKFAVSYKGGANRGHVRVGTVTGLTIDMPTAGVPFSVGYSYYNTMCQLGTDKFVVACKDVGSSYYIYVWVCTVAGTVITVPGTGTQVNSASGSYLNCCSMGVSDKFSLSYYASTAGRIKCATVSGTTPSFGPESTFNAGPTYATYCAELALDKVGVVYRDGTDGNKPKICVCVVTGTTFGAWGIEKTLSDDINYYSALAKLEDNSFIAMYTKDVAPYAGHTVRGTLSGTTVTFSGGPEVYSNDRSYYVDIVVYDVNTYVLVWYDASVAAIGKTLAVTGDLNTIPMCIGLLKESGVIGDVREVDMLGGITESLTGLTPGKTQYIQNDGSVTSVPSDYPIAVAIKAGEAFVTKNMSG